MLSLEEHLNRLNFLNQLPYINSLSKRAFVTCQGSNRFIHVKGFQGSIHLSILTRKVATACNQLIRSHAEIPRGVKALLQKLIRFYDAGTRPDVNLAKLMRELSITKEIS